MTDSLHNTLEEISDSLTTLWRQVRAEAKAGLGSRNKTAEHVLLPVMQRVYSAPGMVNTNVLGPNFPGIDLYDEASGVGVQVTSDASSPKIRKTIETVAAGDLQLTRLVIATIADSKPRYKRTTREKWTGLARGHFEFDPAADVLAFDDLLSRIQVLPGPEINEIAAELQALVEGKHRINLLPHLREQVDRQLAEEKRVARYIPDIFVETRDTKYHARCFGHPGLFVRRIAGWFDRQPLASLNSFADLSGVPPLGTPPTEDLAGAVTPEDAGAAAQAFVEELASLDSSLEAYTHIGTEGGADVPQDPARAHVLDETKYYFRESARGVQWQLKDRGAELACVRAQMFLLTGPAGQGKTNFLCDFTERFLLRHEIPCAYVTARQLGRTGEPDLPEVVRKLIFPPAVANLHEGLQALASACAERHHPFVLVIDGLNEHPDVRAFAGQLEHLLETLVEYPYVRVLMSCRSEFLRQRFGALLSGPLESALHLSEAHGQRFDDNQYGELVARYFRFFKVRPKFVARNVIEFLRRDVLLLRLFCEAYGARDRDDSYQQPFVGGVYRGEIFRRYIEDKLGRADQLVTGDRSTPQPLGRRAQTRRVLSLVADHMLNTGDFSGVPRNAVPRELDAELTALLEEELVLRHDLGPAPSLLTEPTEVLNFTFDEMRDFVLAQRLLAVHADDPAKFSRLLDAQQPSQAQSIEGLQRFLFYASREPGNDAFLNTFGEHPWYAGVYDSEVFAIPPVHLSDEDQRIVEQALSDGGERAQQFARRLAMRWQSSIYRILNLELLLDVARRESPAFFENVIVPTFAEAYYGGESLGKSFCRFVEQQVIPNLAPADEHPYEPLLRLLLLILPVGATPTLDSPAVRAFRALIREYPPYTAGLLQNALPEMDELHRSFIWRLLGDASPGIDNQAMLAAAARADADSADLDTPLRIEAQRFLTRVSTSGGAA